MSIKKIITGLMLSLLLGSEVAFAAEVKIPSEEEKNQLIVYMVKSSVDDPVFTSDIDGNLAFSKNSRRLKDEIIESNACLLINLFPDKYSTNYEGWNIDKFYEWTEGVSFNDDKGLYLIDAIYQKYGIENLAKILSEDSEKSIEDFAKNSGLNLKVNTTCKDIKAGETSKFYRKSDLYFIPKYLFTRWVELGDESAQGITDADVVGSWQFDEMKTLSDKYLLLVGEENKVKNEVQEKFLRLAKAKSKEYMVSLHLKQHHERNAPAFCTLDYSGDDAVAAIGYRLMGDQMLIDKDILNHYEKKEITLNYNDKNKNKNYFKHTFEDIGAAFLSIKQKIKDNVGSSYCNYFIDYPENILKLKNAIERDIPTDTYTAIGKIFNKNDTGDQYAIGKGFDDYEQYLFANNIGADKRAIESLKNIGIYNQLAFKKIQDEIVNISYSNDTSLSNVLTYVSDLNSAQQQGINVVDYKNARLKEEKSRADIARKEEQKRLEEFAREYPYTAKLSCGMGSGDHINIVACFAESKYGAPTELEIRNGQDNRMFKPYNVSQAGSENSSGLVINLRSRFGIKAQNSSDILVLSLVIIDNATGKRIYTQSAAQYDVVYYSK
tara:strand:+ start:233 stop:2050 length:1818 start_codon:yes stop_codon:yes gene_type:complete